MKAIQVFCGSNKGKDSVYASAAKDLGQILAQKGIQLVYGGGNVGLMGILADSVLAAGGTVVGVIPYFLRDREVCHEGLTELVVVNSMAERKLLMAERSEGVIALPGGYGTLDELFEVLTLAQLGQYPYPIGIWNIGGFYDHLLSLVEHIYQEQFLKEIHRSLLLYSDDIAVLIGKMSNYKALSAEGKWLRK